MLIPSKYLKILINQSVYFLKMDKIIITMKKKWAHETVTVTGIGERTKLLKIK